MQKTVKSPPPLENVLIIVSPHGFFLAFGVQTDECLYDITTSLPPNMVQCAAQTGVMWQHETSGGIRHIIPQQTKILICQYHKQ